MSRKNILEAFDMLSAASMVSSQTQATPTYVKNLDRASILVEWTGTSPVGTLEVQAQNIREPVGAASAWETVDMGAPITISGNTGSHTLIFNSLPFTRLRLVYTRTSGTGTLNAIILGKTEGS